MDTLKLNSDGRPITQIPLSVVSWQEAMRLIFLEKATVLKEYDDWVIRSQHLELKVPSIIMMTEHVKWNNSLKYSKQNIFLRDDLTCQLQITNRCASQNGKVKVSELSLDHVVPRSHGGKTNWLNVCTSCKDCNGAKGNDHRILPKKKPHKPTYYEILAKRKTMPVYIHDEDWRHYMDWPDDLIRISPRSGGHG